MNFRNPDFYPQTNNEHIKDMLIFLEKSPNPKFTFYTYNNFVFSAI